MENVTVPMWLLCGLVGTGFVKDTVWKWYRNGRNGRGVDPEDRPRKHTELLTGILAEQKETTRQMRLILEALERR